MSFASADRWRDVYIAAAARGISMAGDFVAATALALTLQTRGYGGFAVAALLLASTLPMIAFGSLGGRLADRFDSRLLLTTVGLVQAAVCVAMAYTGHPVALVALVAALATGLAITQPTFGALVPEMVGRDSLPRAMAIAQTATGLGAIAGPALAGLLVGAYGLRVPLLLDAFSFVAVAAAGLLISTRRGTVAARAVTAAAPPAPAWRLRGDRLLWTLIFAMVWVVGVISMVNVALIFFVREDLGASPTAYGVIEACWMVGMMLGGWAVARWAGADSRLAVGLVALLAGTSTLLLVSAFVPSAAWLVPLWLLGGVANGGENTVASLLIARRVPGAARGRAIGGYVAMVNGAIVVGYAAAGPLVSLVAPWILVAGAGAAGLVAILFAAVPVLRAVRAEPATA